MVLLLYVIINGAHTHARRLSCRHAGRQDWQGSRAGDLVRRFPCKHGANADKHELNSCFYVLAAVYGAYIDISETVQRALVPKYVAGQFRGTAYGLYNMVIGFSFLAANLVFGFLFDSSGI